MSVSAVALAPTPGARALPTTRDATEAPGIPSHLERTPRSSRTPAGCTASIHGRSILARRRAPPPALPQRADRAVTAGLCPGQPRVACCDRRAAIEQQGAGAGMDDHHRPRCSSETGAIARGCGAYHGASVLFRLNDRRFLAPTLTPPSSPGCCVLPRGSPARTASRHSW